MYRTGNTIMAQALYGVDRRGCWNYCDDGTNVMTSQLADKSPGPTDGRVGESNCWHDQRLNL